MNARRQGPRAVRPRVAPDDLVVGAPRGGRRPLRELDAVTRVAIESSRGVIDGDAATAAWDHALTHRHGKVRRCGSTPTC